MSLKPIQSPASCHRCFRCRRRRRSHRRKTSTEVAIISRFIQQRQNGDVTMGKGTRTGTWDRQTIWEMGVAKRWEFSNIPWWKYYYRLGEWNWFPNKQWNCGKVIALGGWGPTGVYDCRAEEGANRIARTISARYFFHPSTDAYQHRWKANGLLHAGFPRD